MLCSLFFTKDEYWVCICIKRYQMKSTEVMSKELLIEAVQLKNGARIYRAVNHVLRQKMLRQLHLKGKMTVTELFVALRIEQSLASQHLAILRRASFVNTERSGKYIYYTINYARLSQIHEVTGRLLEPKARQN